MKWTLMLGFATFAVPVAAQPEQLQVTAPGGTIVATVSGERSRVRIPPAIDELLRQPDAHLTLIHNHPGGDGLSGADLDQLTKPGVDWVVAVGADRSRYAAARGPAFNPEAFIAWQYQVAESEVRSALAHVYWEANDRLDPVRFIPHMTATVLRNVGAIEYDMRPAYRQLEAEYRYFAVFGRVTSNATARLRQYAANRQR